MVSIENEIDLELFETMVESLFDVVVGLYWQDEIVGFGKINKVLKEHIIINTDFKGNLD
jgi:hypothetical protein